MTNSPNPGNDPTPSSPPPSHFRRFRRFALPVGIGLAAGLGGAAWWGWRFLHEELSFIVAKNLSETLNRPVKVGELEGINLNGLQFGASAVPATATDRDSAEMQSIDVKFNLWQSLWSRKLELDVTLEQPKVFLDQEKEGWVTTRLAEEQEEGLIALGTIRLQDANIELLPLKPVRNKRVPVFLEGVNGKAVILDKNKRFVYELAGRSQTGGNVAIAGETVLPSQNTKLNIRAKNFAVAEVDRLIGLPFNLYTGRGGGNFTVELRSNTTKTPINGVAEFEAVTMAVPGVPRPFTNAKGRLQFRGTQIRLDGVEGRYGKATGIASGTLDLDKGFDVAVKVPPTSLSNLLQTLNVTAPVPVVGQIETNLKLTGAIKKPVLTGIARSTAPGKVDRLDLSRYAAAFKLDTAAQELVIQDVQATPTAGGQVTGSGRINLATKDAAGKSNPTVAIALQVLNVPGDAIAQVYGDGKPLPIAIGRVNAQVQVSGPANQTKTVARFQAPNGTYPGSGEVVIANSIITLQNALFKVAGGTVAPQGVVTEGRWRGTATLFGIRLAQFSPDLRGLLSGKFNASGTLTSFKPSDIRVQGTALLSEGLSLIQKPLTAQVQWNGQQVVVQQATATGFSANGVISARVEGTPAITGLDLNVRLSDYNLKDAAVPVPAAVQYAGRTDFIGRITGTPAAPVVNGTAALKQFALNGVAFEPYLQGPVRVAQGVALDLRGNRDRIALALDARYRPIGFDIQRDQAIARGRTQGGLLLTELRNVPLTLIQVPGVLPGFSPSGTLTGDIAINLNQQTANGTVAIAQPGLGNYRADQFTGRLNYANSIATLTEGQLRRGNTVFQIGATIKPFAADPQAQAQIAIKQGNIQDVLTALQLFELKDFQRGIQSPVYGTAADLQTVPFDATLIPVQTQLRRLAELQTLEAQNKTQAAASPLPELRDLKGIFTGTIDVAASLKTGVNAKFNIQGEQFQWGRFNADKIVAIGSFDNGALTLLPFRLQSGDASIAFSGRVLGDEQSGQLRVENLPLDLLTGFVDLPVATEGLLNGSATLSGKFTNPQAVGSFSLANGVLNGTPVQAARGNFTYNDARLDFAATMAVVEKEPLTAIGSLPFQLPFATVAPTSNQVSLDLDVKDEGLALLNVLTNQVSWVSGKGEVKVRVRGTLDNPIATGIVRVTDATLQARALPAPLTNVSGVARFDSDRIRVEKISGIFSEGSVTAQGVIPLSRPITSSDPDWSTPLTVALKQIDLNLKGIYQGGVDGEVIVGRTALNPTLGGTVLLSDGRVSLSDPATLTASTGTDATAGTETGIEFAGLRLTLGDRVAIVQPPLLNFIAKGDLTVNGNFNEIRPEGVIRLTAGQLYLFTTQFALERGFAQTATFSPARQLDPELNIRLVALVAQVNNRRQPLVLAPSEILDVPAPASSFGSLQTIRVRAEVNGPASQLSDILELTSSPPRSEEEIVSLIGGGFIDTFGRGDTLLGIANLAGSTPLFTNVQTAIGNALGLSEFRLFPTSTTDVSRSSGRTSTLGLGAEASLDITPTISVSLLKVITNDQAPQFGLRYRINDRLLFRSSTDFSGDTRAQIEYEARF
ncbi:translocation/assembly module TamB domain-containing protein [Phormidium sp. CLA17]|uniref:translocation/assembly module TamB domain-containing protein n=1 Tax=Leptolyngbya sp. Cla-17 TaxID=2803751 RepID=UPI001492F440|nr:translocation/assembly module TamB [Leptolyngbya sp. Cla-17]MBM0741158.1 translocation/assembly module TamB domain-containing protein [Leptolyngbya sp. Cla-17]